MGKHSRPLPCPTCGGSGQVTVSLDNRQVQITCEVCKGSGRA